MRASGEHAAAGEVKENLADTDANTKWLVFTGTGWARYDLSEPVAVVHYALTSADDAPERDPRDWELQGSHDGQAWTTLDARAGETFTARHQRKEYRFGNTTAYAHYRLNVTRIGEGSTLQLAEWELSDGGSGPRPPSDMRSQVGTGPTGGYVSKPRAGFTGLRALQYAGATTSASGGRSLNKVFEVDLPVTSTTELSYLVFPEFTAADLRYPSTYVSVDLAFDDGTRLSDLKAVDQHGVRLAARQQGESRTLYAGQWNFKRAEIGRVARASGSPASWCPTTARRAWPGSGAGWTTSGSSPSAGGSRTRGARRTEASPTTWSPPGERTPPAASPGATTSRPPRSRTGSTSGPR
ncbi:discoidin domain-containing protein [Nonomuraea thailandensis]